MKMTLFASLLLCTTAALGQSVAGVGAVLNSQPQMLEIPSHEQHASQRPLGEEKNILFTSTNISARGERPLWEAGAKPVAEVPLGDVARMYRNQQPVPRKAVMTLEKQGQK